LRQSAKRRPFDNPRLHRREKKPELPHNGKVL
jgi:hypothetical protein